MGKSGTTLEESLDVYKNTLKKLMALDIDRLLSSHSTIATSKSRLDNYMHCASTMTLQKCEEVELHLSSVVKTLMYTDSEAMETGKCPAICYFNR